MSDYKQFEARMLEKKRVNPDGIFGFQCVDLVKQYLIDEFGIPNGAYGNARQWWESPAFNVLSKFEKVETKDVKAGDVVILKPADNQPRHSNGHLGLATGVQTDSTVEILEQNGSTGTGDGEGKNQIRKRAVPKHRMYGVLRPKATPLPPVPQPPTPPPAAELRSHVVVKGDSLSKIAKQFGLPSWKPLYEKNKGVIGGDPNLIRPGQKLIIP